MFLAFETLSLFLIITVSIGVKILEKRSVTIQSRTSYSVKCLGMQPVKWILPEIPEYHKLWTTVKIQDYTAQQHPNVSLLTFKYGTQLTIMNISYVYTGLYICSVNSCDLSEGKFYEYQKRTNKSRSIYIFVKSKLNLAVDGSKVLFVPLNVTHIPCRPTSKMVLVRLIYMQNDYEEIQMDQSSTWFNYELGFEISSKLLSNGTVSCLYLKGNRIFKQKIVFTLPNFNDLRITPDQPVLVQEYGKSLKLHCASYLRAPCIYWYHPENVGLVPVQQKSSCLSKSLKTNCSSHLQCVTNRNLNIANVDWNQSGTYICVAHNGYKNVTTSKRIIVKIVDSNRFFIDLYRKNDEECRIRKVLDETRTVQFTLEYSSYPTTQLIWLDRRNRRIGPLKRKYRIESTKSKSVLNINHLQINDSGTYRVIVRNAFESKSLKWYLQVVSNPTVRIRLNGDEGRQYRFLDSLFSVECTVVSNPPVDEILSGFEPESCGGTRNCSDVLYSLRNTVLTVDNYTTILYAKHHAIGNGYIFCSAKNSIGLGTAWYKIYVTDTLDGVGFTIMATSRLQRFDQDTFEATVLKGTNLTLTCAASSATYHDNLDWSSLNGNELKVQKSNTKFTNQRQLQIESVESTEVYMCQVENMNGKWDRKMVIVNAVDYEMELVRTYSKGVPIPHLEWLETQFALMSDSGTTQSTEDSYEKTERNSKKCNPKANQTMEKTSKEPQIQMIQILDSNTAPILTFVLVAIGTFLFLAFFIICWKIATTSS